MPLRLDSNVERGRPVHITVDGESIQAYAGESVAAAMLAAGRYIFRHTHSEGQPRGIFCGMGVCYVRLVMVEGWNGTVSGANVRLRDLPPDTPRVPVKPIPLRALASTNQE